MYRTLAEFYTGREWRLFRYALIMERGCECEKCRLVVEDTSRLIGHHIIELTLENVNDPMISLNPDNVRLVCDKCHNTMEHTRFAKVNAPKRVYLIYGSPLSGKTTLARQLMERGDIAVDIDRIYEAITLLPAYDKPNNVRFNVFAIKNLLLDQIKTRYGKWYNAYIIGGYPEKMERERLRDELRAEIIYCECTKQDCLAALYNDKTRARVADQWKKYIDDWWERFQP